MATVKITVTLPVEPAGEIHALVAAGARTGDSQSIKAIAPEPVRP